ncbi:MAG TPA: hypothetical protein VIV55_09405 [Flavobacterium sp.]
MKNILKVIFCTIFFLIITNFSYAQLSYKFIEPNISFSYNKERFEISNRYSNTYYNTESYDFKAKTKTKNDVTITVKANQTPKKVPSIKLQDSIMTSKIEELKTFENDSTSLIENDKTVKYINDFLCIGFSILDKSNKKKTTLITCNHITKNDVTEVTLLSLNSESLSKDYETLKGFLQGFKSYSEEEILDEEKKIKEAFVFKVEKVTKKVEKLSFRENAYIGVFKLNEKTSLKLKEIRIINKFGSENFTPEKNGSVYFACKKNDSEENIGEAIFINSFEKEVIIPFNFKQ